MEQQLSELNKHERVAKSISRSRHSSESDKSNAVNMKSRKIGVKSKKSENLKIVQKEQNLREKVKIWNAFFNKERAVMKMSGILNEVEPFRDKKGGENMQNQLQT